MNGWTFSQNPCKRGKSHQKPPHQLDGECTTFWLSWSHEHTTCWLTWNPLSFWFKMFFSDLHQVHQWASPGCESWIEANVRKHHAGLPGLLQPAPVEAHAVRRGIPAHRGARASQVWPPRLEHPLRVQCSGLQRQCTVCAESPGRHGHQKGGFPL